MLLLMFEGGLVLQVGEGKGGRYSSYRRKGKEEKSEGERERE